MDLKILDIDENLRLRPFDNHYGFALPWYQDQETVELVDGKDAEIFDLERVGEMYEYLKERGELYWIDIKESENWKTIGDVTLMKDSIPIVIGPKEYRHRGIGKKVISRLIERARELDYEKIVVKEIFDYNITSRKMYESLGFHVIENTKDGFKMELWLKDKLTIGSIVWGVIDLKRAQHFWMKALDYIVASEYFDDTWVILRPRVGRGVQLTLSKITSDRPKRHHLDLYAHDREKEVSRLLELGATRKNWDYPEESDYTVLIDPEGNPFCVVQI